MGLFSKAPKVSADGYERKTVQGKPNRGKVAKMLAEGWEIENSNPVLLKGNSTGISEYLLKRRAQ